MTSIKIGTFNGYLKNIEKETIRRILLKELNTLNLFEKIKEILLTYDSQSRINENNRMYFNVDSDRKCHKTRIYELCSSREYIFKERKVDIELLPKLFRHELVHLYDIYDRKFKYNVENDKQYLNYDNEYSAILSTCITLVWNIYIDSRLPRGLIEGKKLESCREKKDRRNEFIGFVKDEKWFKRLWDREFLTFDDIIAEGKKIYEIQ